MLSYAINVPKPDQGQHRTERSHEPEAAFPASRMNDPSEDGREDQQREILRGIEDCGGSAALHGGKP